MDALDSQGTDREKKTVELLQKEEECHGLAWKVQMHIKNTATTQLRAGESAHFEE